MNCNTTHYRANSSSVPGDPTAAKNLESYWHDWANYIATLPPAVLTQMQVIEGIERSGAPEFQQLQPVRDVPVSVVLAGKIVPEMWTNRPCEPQACFARWLDYRKAWLRPLMPLSSGCRCRSE